MAIINELMSMLLFVPIIFLYGTVTVIMFVIYASLAFVLQLEEVLCPVAVA